MIDTPYLMFDGISIESIDDITSNDAGEPKNKTTRRSKMTISIVRRQGIIDRRTSIRRKSA